jgi:ammonium transporter Rh
MGKQNKLGISRAEITFIICELICIVLYGLFTDYYGGLADPKNTANDTEARNHMHLKYPLF